MIPNKHPHTGPPGRIVTWGSPWHGPCQDGNVTLPNDQQMAYSQTDQGGSGGDVIVFRPPGTKLPKRPAEWEAADAAAGREWRDYALVTGWVTRCLYGKSLGKGHGCWLYAAPDGSRWLISTMSVPVTADYTSSWTRTFTATRFGDIAVGTAAEGEWSSGVAQEEHSLQATLTDWQQAIAGKTGGDYYIDGVGSVTSGEVWLEDASITGAHAVFMTGLNYPSEPIRRRSLGFVEVEITGTPGVDWTVAMSVLRTREQTLGEWVFTEDRTSDADLFEIAWPSPTITEQDGSGAGTPPTCGGVFVTTITPQTPTVRPYPSGYGVQILTYIGVLTYRIGFTGRIVAMAYHGENEIAGEVKLDAITEGTINADSPTGKMRPKIYTQESIYGPSQGVCGPQGVEVVSSYLWERIEQHFTGVASSNVTLTMPDGTVITAPLGGTMDGHVTFDSDASEAIPDTWEVVRHAGDRTLTHNNRLYPGWPGLPYHYSVSPSHNLLHGQLHQYAPSLNTYLGWPIYANDGFFGDRMYQICQANNSIASRVNGLSFFRTQLRRYSNKLFEFEVVEYFVLDDASEQDLRTIQMGAAGTGGHDFSTVITEDGQPVPAYGSHNPVTGEIRRAQSSPVIYV